MKIVYDDIVYSLQKTGGISVMWSNITANPPYPAVHIRYQDAATNMFGGKMDNCIYEEYNSRGIIAKRFLNVRRKESEPYLFHSSYFRYCTDPNAINITTVYDFIFEYYFKGPLYVPQKLQKRNAVMHSDGVICISENTKQDLLKFYPGFKGDVRVIHCGYDSGTYFYEKADKEKIILFVGSRTFYKRFDLAIEIVKNLPQYQLAIVGGGELTKKESEMLEEKLPNRYEKCGYLTNEELRALYNRAFCLVYCSDYEGFGIPPLEAQACGCPVICQPKSSLPEVVGESAVLLDVQNLERSVERINKLQDSAFYRDIVEAGLQNVKRFSWSRCREEVFDFYSDLLQRKGIS